MNKLKMSFGLHQTELNIRLKKDQLDHICDDTRGAIYSYYDKDFKKTIVAHHLGLSVNPRTAQIKLNDLVCLLAKLMEIKPFKSIHFESHYFEATEEQLMQMVIEKYKSNQ